MNKKDFDRIHVQGKKLRKIFERDRVRIPPGIEDYLIRAVEETTNPATPAWIPCECGEFWCTLHQQHVSECPCPAIDDWDIDPYTERPNVQLISIKKMRDE
jgi:hypothetical protein